MAGAAKTGPGAAAASVSPTKASEWQQWARAQRSAKPVAAPAAQPAAAPSYTAPSAKTGSAPTYAKAGYSKPPAAPGTTTTTTTTATATTPAPSRSPIALPTLAPTGSGAGGAGGFGGQAPSAGGGSGAQPGAGSLSSGGSAGGSQQAGLSPMLIGIVVAVVVVVVLMLVAAYVYTQRKNAPEPYMVWDAWKQDSDFRKSQRGGVELGGVRASEGRRSSAGYVDNIYGSNREAPDFLPYVAPAGSKRMSFAAGAGLAGARGSVSRGSVSTAAAGARGSVSAAGSHRSISAGSALPASLAFSAGKGLAPTQHAPLGTVHHHI